MQSEQAIIFIHPDAPAKPPQGSVCNGCGVCCLWIPCPLGVVLSGRRQGACTAVRWDADRRRYQCGAITAPGDVLQSALPGRLAGLARWWSALLPRIAARWIAAGDGCDCSAEATAAVSPTIPAEVPLPEIIDATKPPTP